MKKILLLAFVMAITINQQIHAYDYWGTIGSGQTLYFRLVSAQNLTVAITNQLGVTDQCGYNTAPTGNLVIPATITVNNGITYTVVEIDSSAFESCTGLTSVTIPNTITTIGYSAFYGCSGLTGSLIIPTSVTMIDLYAFTGCSSLTNVIIGDGVQGIGNYAFYNCPGLVSVTIGTGLKSMGKGNFSSCLNLTTVNYYADSCTTFGSSPSAFGWSGVQYLNIGENVKCLPVYSFYDCDNLTNLTIPNSVKTIGYFSFYQCDGLQHVNIASINTIGYGCFDSCLSLQSVSIGTVKNLEGWCFAECPQLRHVEIGDSLQKVGEYCFIYDSALNYVKLGQDVDSIKNYAFYACVGIDTIECHAMIAPKLGVDVFYGVPSNATLMIPCGSTHYESRWSMFDSPTIYNPLIFNAITDDPTKGIVIIHQSPTCTSPNATVIAQPNSGYHFDHWSDGSTDNPYLLTVENDMTLIGYFVSDVYILQANSANETMGTVQIISSPTPTNPQGTVVAMPNDGYDFDHWSNGVTANPYTLTLTQDTSIVAYFVEQTIVPFNITAVSSDINKGTVQILSQPTVDDPRATVVAVPNTGYQFDHWSDGVTTNPYQLTLTSDTVIIAYFTDGQGIGDVAESLYSVNVHGKQVVVETTVAAPVEVYDIRGRRIYISNENTMYATCEVPVAGIYLVRVGQGASKVVVL